MGVIRKMAAFVLAFLFLAIAEEGVCKGCRTSRPRLLFDRERVERLCERIEEQGAVREGWLKLRQRADRLLKADLVSREYAESGKGQHGNYGRPSSQMSDMGQTLGLAYQVTREKRYAEKLREALLHYGKYRRWGGEALARRDPPWHSELNTARFCHGYAIGYDCIHDFLSSEDRKKIAEAMVRLGILPTLNDWILPEKRIHALDSMGHNWWSVCVGEAGVAALSLLGDDPRAEEWVERVYRGFPLWFSYRGNVLQNKSPNFDDGGAFYESVGYANYALSEYLLFRLAYSNIFPRSPPPDIPVLEKAGDFFLHTCYPTSSSLLTVNFGDHNLHGNAAATVRLLLANSGTGVPPVKSHGQDAHATSADGKLQWYLERTDAGLSTPLGLLYFDASRKAVKPVDAPRSAIYPDIGWAILRSTWEDNSTLLAVKSGFTWNHAHADAGSFILFHAGEPLIIDSGTCSYGRREYVGYYCQSRAHNVVLFNGQGQNPEDIRRGVKSPGKVHQLLELDGLSYVYADATGPTSLHFSRNYRHFLWVGNVILIFDDLRTHESGRIQWLLHYEGKAEKRDGGFLLSKGRARALVRTLFPENLTVTEEEGLADHKPDVKVAYLSFSPREETRQTKFVTAILPLAEGEEDVPRLERLEGPEMLGVRILENGTVTEVYLNLRADGRRMHVNTNNTIAGWDTDAYLFAVTRSEGSDANNPDSASRYFVACGSYLRRNGKVVLDSLSKVYAAFSMGKRDMDVVLQGQPFIEASIRSARKPQNVLLNGEKAPVEYNEPRKLVNLTVKPR